MTNIAAQIAHELLLASRAYRVAVWSNGYKRSLHKMAMRRAIERAQELRQHAKDYDFWVTRYCHARTDEERMRALVIVNEIGMAA